MKLRNVLFHSLLAMAAMVSPVLAQQHQVALGQIIASGPMDAPQEIISDAEHAALWQTIQENIGALRAQGRLESLKANLDVRFSWPTRSAPGRPEFHDHAVFNYVDNDPAVNSVKDYMCAKRTYDTSAANGAHKGTDIGIGLKPFYKMDTEQVIVVAAAPGVIVAKDDTQPDRACGDLSTLFNNTTLKNNVISIRHADGSVAIYYHMKTGSLTAKKVGDAVDEGEYLAVVGSAGFSSQPHLHFEVRAADNSVIDPWVGACNPTTTVSLWKAQQSYHTQEIMELTPSSMTPSPDNLNTACTNNVASAKSASGYFQPDFYAKPGVPHNFVAFVRDMEAGTPISFTLKRPDGSEYFNAGTTGPGYSEASYLTLGYAIATGEPSGKWSFSVTYGGKTKSVPFYFNVSAPALARVYEFYHAGLNHYFSTASAPEAQSLTPATGFLPTGDDYFALDRSVVSAGVSPVCRFYGSIDPGPNSHFYTADPGECTGLKDIAGRTPPSTPRWNYEETAFAAVLPDKGQCPAEAPFPVYRLYNKHAGEMIAGKREDSNHRFTTKSSVFNQMWQGGWQGEGVVMCAGSKP